MRMKSYLTTTLFAAAFGASAHAGLIAHYTFDETSGTTAADSVRGAAGDATLVVGAGDVGTKWVAGQMGGAIDLDGSNDYLHALDPITSDLANYSASVWIQRDGGSSWQTFLTSWGERNHGFPSIHPQWRSLAALHVGWHRRPLF